MAETAASSPGRIFICYRREETAYPAGWLFDRLAEKYGDRVFKDVDSIELGDDFVAAISAAVGSCDVLLALIGKEWLTILDEGGQRRLDDPADFVRLEIEAALTRDVRVIPILVNAARMPRAAELPAGLTGLVRRQALELSPARFDFDTSRLLRVLDRNFAEMRTANESAGASGGVPQAVASASGTHSERRRRRFSLHPRSRATAQKVGDEANASPRHPVGSEGATPAGVEPPTAGGAPHRGEARTKGGPSEAGPLRAASASEPGAQPAANADLNSRRASQRRPGDPQTGLRSTTEKSPRHNVPDKGTSAASADQPAGDPRRSRRTRLRMFAAAGFALLVAGIGAVVLWDGLESGTGSPATASTTPPSFSSSTSVATQPTPTPPPQAQGDSVEPGEVLNPDQSISSANGSYILYYQSDGNLVLYKGAGPPSPGPPLWDSNTVGETLGICTMETNGNFAIRAAGKLIWSSHTAGNPGSRLVVGDDGNVAIFDARGTRLWSTHTAQG
jgi:hypothetical protein